MLFPGFQLSHTLCQVWTLLNNEKFKKVALFIANQQANFVVNHAFSIKTMFPHNLVKKSAQPSSQNPNLWWLVFNKHFSTILISSLSSSFRNDRVLLYLYPFKYFRNKYHIIINCVLTPNCLTRWRRDCWSWWWFMKENEIISHPPGLLTTAQTDTW